MSLLLIAEFCYISGMKKQPLFDYVLDRLDANKGRHKEISETTGISYSTISKIVQRVTPNPGVLVIQALADYFNLYDSRILTRTKLEKLHIRGNKPK